MRYLVAAFAALVLAHNAYAQGHDFQKTTDLALAAGSPAAIVKKLDKESYRGNLIAAHQLGLIYRDGKTVPQDLAKARKYLKTSASGNLNRIWYRRGYAEAQYDLAVMLQAGSGGTADPSAAESWFEVAAEQGHVPAQFALARMYFSGAGIKRDLERAFFWASLAAQSSGNTQKEAEQIRDQSQQQLEPVKLAKARNLVNGWKRKT